MQRSFRLLLPIVALAAVSSAQPYGRNLDAANAGPNLKGRVALRAPARALESEALIEERSAFGNTPTSVSFGVARTDGNGRRLSFKAAAERLWNRDQMADAGASAMAVAAQTTQSAASVTLGQPLTLPFSLPSVAAPTLFAGDYGVQVVVPAGTSQLEIDVNATPGTAQVALFARFGQDVNLSSGQVVADYSSPGVSATQRIVVSPSSNPPLQAGTYYVAFGLFSTGVAVSGELTVTASGSNSDPNLRSGIASSFSLPAVSGPTLFNGEYGYSIAVPAGARSLTITLATTTPEASVALYSRLGQDIALSDGKPVADQSASDPSGNQQILITPASQPALAAGRYYIALGLFSAGRPVSGSITATVDTGNPAPVKFTFSFPAIDQPTLFAGDYGATVTVPQGATKLVVQIHTDTANVNLGFYVRYGQDVELAAGRPIADYVSEDVGDNHTITITTSSERPLKAGVYYLAYGVFTTGTAVSGSGTATITTQNTSTQTCSFTLPAVDYNTLFTGDFGCSFAVQANATRLEIRVSDVTPNADVDLYVRGGQDVDLANGRVVADFGASAANGNADIVITRSSTPALQPGAYFVGFGVFTHRTKITGKVTAIVTQ